MRAILLVFLAVLACSRRFLPPDEASDKERAAVAAVVDEVEGRLRALGNTTNLRELPIIVVGKSDANIENREGYCAKLHGQSRFIAVAHDAFTGDSDLFMLLLHEFGHCYFHREHETAVLKVAGTVLLFGSTLSEFPLSAMYQRDGARAPPEFSSPGFHAYYVAELIGRRRLTSPAELAEFHEIAFHPK